jgi:hypothetical protein
MRVTLIVTACVATARIAASMCGSIPPAYSAVHDPSALNSTQSPRSCETKTPAGKEPLPSLHETATRAVAETGPRNLELTISPNVDRRACDYLLSPRHKVNGLVVFVKLCLLTEVNATLTIPWRLLRERGSTQGDVSCCIYKVILSVSETHTPRSANCG